MTNTTWKALGLIGIGLMVQNYISRKPKKDHPFLKGLGEGLGKELISPTMPKPISKVPYQRVSYDSYSTNNESNLDKYKDVLDKYKPDIVKGDN